MLAPLQEKDFEKYVGFAYELALDPARSGYPACFDGIKTKEDFITAICVMTATLLFAPAASGGTPLGRGKPDLFR